MEVEIVSKILENMLAQGPLVGYLFYQNWKADKRAEEQAKQIAELNTALRDKAELYLNKAYEISTDAAKAISGLKDIITVKNNA